MYRNNNFLWFAGKILFFIASLNALKQEFQNCSPQTPKDPRPVPRRFVDTMTSLKFNYFLNKEIIFC